MSCVDTVAAPALEISRPCYLFVKQQGNELWVYRSVLVKDDDDMYLPVLELVGGSEPLIRRIVEDPEMAFETGEHLVYALEDNIVH